MTLIVFRIFIGIKNALKHLCSLVDLRIVRKVYILALLRQKFDILRKLPVFKHRHGVYDTCLERVGMNEVVTCIEFGVAYGRSMRHFVKQNTLSGENKPH